MTDNILDVAIIGGGISGVYSAWRLLTDGGRKSVTVFEADNHIGGRLLSVTPPGIENMVAELGGMRILPRNIQPLVNTLICKLNEIAKEPQSGIDTLKLYDLPVNGPYGDDGKKETSDNIVFTRGMQFRWSDIGRNPENIPYKLQGEENKKPLGQLILDAIKTINPAFDEKKSPAENRDTAQNTKYKGLPLYQQGFWDVLIQVMSYEAYRFEQDAGGYLTTLSNWNAADAIPWFLADFSPTATYRGFAQGYRQVVVNMAKLFTKAGGNIVCDRKLAGFKWDSNVFTLKFANGETVQAKALILAMPRRSLELLSCGNEYNEYSSNEYLSNDATSKLIKSVTPKPAFKIFSTYQEPWWKKLGVSLGRTLTDLPLRQTYYWTGSKGDPIEDGPAMLMASYDDGTNTEFWNGYRDRGGAKWRAMGRQQTATNLTAKNSTEWSENAPEWDNYQYVEREQTQISDSVKQTKSDDEENRLETENVTQQLIDEVTRQLAEIHGVDAEKIRPKEVFFKDWSDDPFGGGWNFWNIGVKSPEVMQSIIQPCKDDKNVPIPLYICGDAYSNWQGWVEGALETANMVLHKFNVKPIYSDIEITTTKLPDAFYPIGGSYYVKLEAIGGSPYCTYTWRKVKGDLPPGISLATNGIIDGNAKELGKYEFGVVASDAVSGKISAAAQFSITVNIVMDSDVSS